MTNAEVSAVNRNLGPALWREAYYGMTVGDILAAFPAAREPTEQSNLHDGASAALELPDIALAGDRYNALFYFRNARLTQVTLACQDPATIAAGKELLTLLRARYGPEISLSLPDDGAFMLMLQAEWLTGNGMNVCLACIEGVALNVNYQMRVYAEASKL